MEELTERTGYSSSFGILGILELTQRNFDITDLPLAFVATYGMIRFLGWCDGPRLETPASPLATRTVPPEPRLQVDAPKEFRSLQASEQEALTSYGWVSREAGIARIPIRRAMQLVLERGLPVTTSPAAPKASAKGGAQ